MLKLRLDRISNETAKLRRDMDVLLESFALFVRWQLTVQAPLPEGDAGASAGNGSTSASRSPSCCAR